MAAIVGIVASLVGPAIELGKFIAAPIKRQFNYLCCFNRNIQSLRGEAQQLNAARTDLQKKVEEAERNAQVGSDEVTNWLRRADKIQQKMRGFETEIPNVQSGCLTVKSRFLLSRKARKTTDVIKELRSSCKFNFISHPCPPAAMQTVRLGDVHEFQSRKQIEDDIMEALRSENVNMMGICGMGGVGKTTMAKKIMNRVREENLFNEVVMVVISQQVDMQKIQQEIAEYLGLKFEEESLSARANKLRARLMGDKKRILVVLDDVWEKLKLEDLGIPSESGFKGCNVLLTSRSRDVLNRMDVQKVCEMEILSETEAWSLFKEKVGTWLNDSVNLHSIAEQVARECQGLPIALITVGSTLKDMKSKPIWEDALHQLKTSNPIDMPDVLREVYNPFKLSYEFLENQHAQSLFLLCCLFPEDYEIPLEWLTFYCVGLCIFGGIRNLEQARNRVVAIVEMLKSRFLLLNGGNEAYVRMHDVIRDIAIFIASKEGLIDANWSRGNSSSDCKWISVISENRSELPNLMRLSFPSLRLLMMPFSSSSENFEIKEDFCFSKGMKELNVLSFEDVGFKSIQLLKNLRTLHLYGCRYLETISVVGEELLSLEILCCRNCGNIKELPIEIGRLNSLKLLEFSHCRSLRTIPPRVISNMRELEELKITDSFCNWESGEEVNAKRTRKNVSLKELESLSSLRCLEIEMWDDTLATEKNWLSSMSSIVKFYIGLNSPGMMIGTGHAKSMALNLRRGITLGSLICDFLTVTEKLYLKGDGSNISVLSKAQKHLKSLEFVSCSTVKKLVDTTSISIDCRSVGGVFPTLEFMKLEDLENLEEICDWSIFEELPNSFKNLKELSFRHLPALKHLWESNPNQNLISFSKLSFIKIEECGKLRYLFSLAIAKDVLPQLEKLTIGECGMMEEIFSNDGGDQLHTQIITFPKLRTLSLFDLKSLTAFCKGIEGIEFPVLNEMKVSNCPKLKIKSLVSSSTGSHGDDKSCHLFCNLKVPYDVFFPMLESLALEDLPNLEEICDGSILQGSPNSFKNLKELSFHFLPALKHLWKSSPNQNLISLTNLSSIHIWRCGKLHYLFSLAIAKDALPRLEGLTIMDCEMMEEIFKNDEFGPNQSHCQIITFPKLRRLSLRNLQSLTTLCAGLVESIEFPVLAKLKIRNCPKFTTFGNNHQNLRSHDDNTFHLFCSQKVTFGSLKHLQIGYGNVNIANIWCQQIPLDFFSGLKMLEIIDCGSISSLFSSSIVGKLVNLKVLIISNCSEMEKVIVDEEKLGKEPPFHRLETLELINLPKLRSLCFGNLANLKELIIKSCQEIEKVIVDEEKLGEEPRFHRLEKLRLLELPKLQSFGIGNLVNLKELRIVRCMEIEQVIGDEEKFCENSPFPKLKNIILRDLSKLKTFCRWSCDLKLPCLIELYIYEYPLMEYFTIGSISTPELKWIEIDGDYLENVRDLNVAIKQWRFRASERLRTSTAQGSTSSSAEGEKGDQQEEQENKSEINEEEIE